MDISFGAGLAVTYNDKTGVITFDWDPETHPEYNYLQDLTPEKFSQLLQDYLDKLNEEESTAEVPAGGSSGGEAEVSLHSEHPV